MSAACEAEALRARGRAKATEADARTMPLSRAPGRPTE